MLKTKLTRKQFVEIMMHNANILVAACHNREPESFRQIIENDLSKREIHPDAEIRTVVKANTNRIVFNTESIFEFGCGKYNITEYINDAGVRFVVTENIYKDTWTSEDKANYIIYIIVQAENSQADRIYKGLTVTPEKSEIIRSFLKCNGYKYELSGCGKNKHFEILCSDKEFKIIMENLTNTMPVAS